MDLGARIAAWRKAKGMTQRDLAKAVGITHSAVCQWEDGNGTQPLQQHLQAVVDAFGITMEKFYGRVPTAKAS